MSDIRRAAAVLAAVAVALVAGCALSETATKQNPAVDPKFVDSSVKLRIVDSVGGSPSPRDLNEPHMPAVDVLSDMDAIFAIARSHTEDDNPTSDKPVKPRHVVVVTPGRIMLPLPLLDPKRVPADPVAHAKSVFRNDHPLNISVIGYTRLEALMQDGAPHVLAMNRAIPFLGHLVAYAYAGNSVVVFEGHSSAFEAGIRGSDVLIVDSGMAPFLQKDWAAVAFKTMRVGGRIFVHDRRNYTLNPVVLSKREPGWQYTEPDGEGSYANCLLTTMIKAQKKKAVRITVGMPLPDLAAIATDPNELEWISTLPFKYDQLDVEEVIQAIVRLAKPDRSAGSLILRSMLALPALQTKDALFRITERRSSEGRRQIEIEQIEVEQMQRRRV